MTRTLTSGGQRGRLYSLGEDSIVWHGVGGNARGSKREALPGG